MAREKTESVSEEEGLLRTIRANPADDLTRLVYCDWLEERGQTERAEFIRWQLRRPEHTLRPVSIKLEGRPRGNGSPYHEACKIADCLEYRPWTVRHRRLSAAMYGTIDAPGRSVLVSNPGRSCGVVWRRGFVAACWASYVSYTRPVVRLLQGCPLEIFHYYGDTPGASRVDGGVRSAGAAWRYTLEYHWHDFRTTEPFESAEQMYEPGGHRYSDRFRSDRYSAVGEAFHKALTHFFPALHGFHEGHPTADDWRAYQTWFYPGAQCESPVAGIGSVSLLPVEFPGAPAG